MKAVYLLLILFLAGCAVKEKAAVNHEPFEDEVPISDIKLRSDNISKATVNCGPFEDGIPIFDIELGSDPTNDISSAYSPFTMYFYYSYGEPNTVRYFNCTNKDITVECKYTRFEELNCSIP